MFPKINNLNDVLPYIKDKEEFKVKDHGIFKSIDYIYASIDTFDSPQAQECKGIKFDANNQILARPFHKFFNRGERNDERKDFSNIRVFEKYDGCLVHTTLLQEKPRLMTIGGITDYSLKAEKWFNPFFMTKDELKKFTFIFEFLGYHAGVIRYDKPALVLLAVRENISGYYLDIEEYKGITTKHNVSFPREYSLLNLTHVKDWVGKEGVVLVWHDGYRMKVKSDDYVLKHRTKESLTEEKNVLEVVIRGEIDDLASLVSQREFTALRNYQDKVEKNIDKVESYIKDIYYEVKDRSRKDIAIDLKQRLSSPLFAVFWAVYKGKPVRESLETLILQNLSSKKHVEKIRPLIGAVWEAELEKETETYL
jgi:RNA ligase